jgi:hypothetical protein
MNSYLRIFQSIVHLESHIPENRIVASVFNLLRLTSDLNTWTYNFVVTHSDQSIDVSLLLKGLYLLLPHLAHSHTKKFNIPVQSIILTKIYFLVLMLKIYSSKCSNLPNALMVAS